MSATDGADSPKPWDNEAVEPVLPDLLGDTQNVLSDDVFEQILAAAMEPNSDLADESLIPADDDPELTEDGHFVNPEEAELFLDDAADAEDDDEEAEMEVEDDDDDHRDASDDDGDDDHDFDFDDLYSGDDNSDDDFGGVLS
ncbi:MULTISPECIES: hypothetical protein [Corynebacterium]|uniref:hypothetical protein n=1 Tax=Corynebacterium TaxID=1716 RepID=UPI0008A49697|nr:MULTISPECIES: hypothetical protein [Corynebacterium]KAA9224860.1 hypothetical protein F6I44_02405 [Corynebacterium amycolatum]MDK6442509.1 hypothetical protein [Corynebacterium amycolatum]MDK8818587.1 hypothetical protein [Corynebacterium amycolatum]OFT69121.1 hypothetical protein HMPREF3130_09845 [Corynebacterium sp. HMSC14B06]OHR23111.1 hypothetical protein HMPREF2787_04435 [Corynebacterium sp. HMSC061H03]